MIANYVYIIISWISNIRILFKEQDENGVDKFGFSSQAVSIGLFKSFLSVLLPNGRFGKNNQQSESQYPSILYSLVHIWIACCLLCGTFFLLMFGGYISPLPIVVVLITLFAYKWKTNDDKVFNITNVFWSVCKHFGKSFMILFSGLSVINCMSYFGAFPALIVAVILILAGFGYTKLKEIFKGDGEYNMKTTEIIETIIPNKDANVYATGYVGGNYNQYISRSMVR
jgi:hypothetical protein